MKTVLVYGWYGRGNVGDELFRNAFQRLLPDMNIKFVSRIEEQDLEGVDAVVFGGGSFVYARPHVTHEAMVKILTMPVFYVGVGVEKTIDPAHQRLMKRAHAVFTRSTESLDLVRAYNPTAEHAEDIVFSLHDEAAPVETAEKTILVMPNLETVPKWSSPHWMHVAWDHFKDELAQALDVLVSEGWTVSFLPSCRNASMDDTWAATEVLARMEKRSACKVLDVPEADVACISSVVSKHQVVVTQRYHGAILAKLSGRPCVMVHHHDKLKNIFPAAEQNVSFYASSKAVLLDAIKDASEQTVASFNTDFSKITEAIKEKLK